MSTLSWWSWVQSTHDPCTQEYPGTDGTTNSWVKDGLEYTQADSITIIEVHTNHCKMPTLHSPMGFVRYFPGSIHFRRAIMMRFKFWRIFRNVQVVLPSATWDWQQARVCHLSTVVVHPGLVHGIYYLSISGEKKQEDVQVEHHDHRAFI